MELVLGSLNPVVLELQVCRLTYCFEECLELGMRGAGGVFLLWNVKGVVGLKVMFIAFLSLSWLGHSGFF